MRRWLTESESLFDEEAPPEAFTKGASHGVVKGAGDDRGNLENTNEIIKFQLINI